MNSLCRAALASLLAATLTLPAQAAKLKSAQVTAVINEVNLIDPGGSKRAAKVDDTVRGDQGVRTGQKSRTELRFPDKTMTRLGANTVFTFTAGTRDLELERGTMLLRAPKGAGGARIRTAAVTVEVAGATLLLEYSPALAQAGRELKKPSRNSTAAELAEPKRRSKMPTKNRGFVKVMVMEGTLRLFLNTRVGESTLISAGQMVILSPDAFQIPPPVEFDLARLAQTSLLANNRFWGDTATELNMAMVGREISAQQKLINNGDLLLTNLIIPGGGTNVMLAPVNQGIDQGITTNPTVLAAVERTRQAQVLNRRGQPASSGETGSAAFMIVRTYATEYYTYNTYTDSFVVNSPDAIAVNSALRVTGVNGAFGGRAVLNSTGGEITINAPIMMFESTNAPPSVAGGSIKLTSGRTSGPAITINNTGELLTLLNSAAPGPGGRIEVTSAGGDIRVNGGKLIAGRGTIDVRNAGIAGIVQLNAAQLAADVIKVGALGTNGQLTITAGSQLNADRTLQLYGGSGDLGRVLFTGSGTVNISGNPIHIAGKTVEVSNATHVNNNGPTNVHADNQLYGIGAGGGKFGSPVTAGPLTGAPPF